MRVILYITGCSRHVHGINEVLQDVPETSMGLMRDVLCMITGRPRDVHGINEGRIIFFSYLFKKQKYTFLFKFSTIR